MILPPITALNLSWLVRLRWAGGLSALVIAIVALMGGTPFPWITLGTIVIGVTLTNLYAMSREGSVRFAFSLMAIDIVALTVLLRATGGVYNPFTSLYLVFLGVGVIILPTRWRWLLLTFATLAYGSLFIGYDAHAHHDMAAHLRGMWLAFAATAVFITFFAGQLQAEIRRLESALLETQHAASRLDSMATLAAGAAHELGTPLGTIAIAVGELKRGIPDDSPQGEDLDLIQHEVGRCRRVLDQLSLDVGVGPGEAAVDIQLGELLEHIKSNKLTMHIASGLEERSLHTYPRVLERAVRNLVDNALRATDQEGEVILSVDGSADGRCVFTVKDNGVGMTPQVAKRAREPFFSTRAHQAGMGLGLWLAERTAIQLGGGLSLNTEQDRGTEVRLWIAWSVR